MLREFHASEDPHSTKRWKRHWIFVYLSFGELYDSNLSGLHLFDNVTIIYLVKYRWQTEGEIGVSWIHCNFCDPHCELLYQNKLQSGTREISIQPEIGVATKFHEWHGTKTTPVFLPANGEDCWLLLLSSVSLLSSGAVQPENIYFCIFKVTGQIWKSQKKDKHQH